MLPGLRGGSDEQALAAQVVDAHLRSLQPGHLTDVTSTDQHTVKPWFDGRVDFAPPVRDFVDEGFPLQGGRLDIIHGRSVAAPSLLRPVPAASPPAADTAPHSGSQLGYQWIDWRKGGMEFCAVSDTSIGDLQELQRLFAR